MLGLGKTLPWLMNAGKGLLSKGAKLGAAALGLVGIDVVANDGNVTKGIFNKGVDFYNETLNTAAVDLDNTQSLLNTQAEGMAWFNSWNSFFYSLCDFFGFEQGKDFFKDRMERTNVEIRDFIDDQRDALTNQNKKNAGVDDLASRESDVSFDPNSGEITPAVPGEVSVGSAFASAAYGLEKGVVSMAAGLSSLGTGTWEALTTDKGWGAAIADDFNQQNGWAMEKLESLHGKPNVDTPLERGLMYGFEFGSYLIPVAGTAKLAGSVPQALTKFTPALGLAAGPK
ncbi:MAG: hypothetical protein CL561_03780 [Alphaproteobacteria bacterium]|nr:hypothetical protein [Alphaproteobacteria bacterium]|tara:strand:+ start:1993 stop:2847 length:855 start_codon:yes stop_codon:yes gene_type:complete